jgi:hypothetical protein
VFAPQQQPPRQVAPPVKNSGVPRSDAPLRTAPMVTVIPGTAPPVEADPMVKPATLAAPMPAPAPMNPLTIPDPMVPKNPPTNPLTIPDPVVPKNPLTIPDPVVPTNPPKDPLTIPDPMVPTNPTKGPLTLPDSGSPKGLPPIVVPDAKPMAAPAPTDAPIVPLPEPRKAPKSDKGNDDLPPIILPPEGTGTSNGVIPTTSKSSPLAGAIKVQVFSAAGTAAGNLRKVGFFNHTGRDLDLVIEGRSVKLPKKSYLNAELPTKFTWKAAGNDAVATTVPTGAAGVDVLFKE